MSPKDSGDRTSPLGDDRLEEVVDRYMEELADGRQPDQEAYLRQHPELAEQLKGVFKTLHLVEAAGKSLNAAKLDKGQKLGEFRIVREIGRGGMGVVYEAEQTSLNRRVALKVLPANVMISENALERFDREAHTAGKLHHTNIVPVYAVGEESGISYYAMQFIKGRSLAYFLKTTQQAQMKPGPEHYGRVARWGQQAADALAYAHDQGVIHRDIKPANLLLDQRDNVWVFDFGLARSEDSPTITQSGDLIGTARYMSPEQISTGGSFLDRRTDLYSLGATLYELIAFRPAFDAESHAGVLQQISVSEPRPLRQLAPSVPRDLETIIAKCMHKDPALRYQNAADVAEDLRRFLSGEPILAKRDSFWYLAQKTLRRHKLPVAAAATFVLFVMASAITLGIMYGQQRNLRQQAEDQARMIRAERDRAERQAQIAKVERERAEAQAQIAKAERDRAVAAETTAKQRFDQVRDLANSVIFDIHDRIVDLPGSTPAREVLVSKGLQYLDNLARESSGDPLLLKDLMHAYLRIGDVQGGAFGGAHLGDTTGAMKSYKKALEMCEAWQRAGSENGESLRGLAICYDRIADMQATSGQTEEALKLYRKELEICRRQAEADAADPRARRSVAVALNKIGNVLKLLGRREEALQAYKDALSELEALLATEPTSERFREDVCVSRMKIGMWLVDAKLPDEALPYLVQSLHIAEALLAANATNARFQRLVSVCYDNLGSAYAETKRLDEALVSFRKGLEISETLAAADPTNAQAQRDLEVSYNNIGRLESQTERQEEALVSFEKALKIAETLSAADPENAYFNRDAALCLRLTAGVLRTLGRRPEAMSRYQRALGMSKAISAADPSNAAVQSEVQDACVGLATLHTEAARDRQLSEAERMDHWEAAKGWYEQAREAVIGLRDRGQLAEPDSGAIDELTRHIAECEEAMRQPMGADQ